jgi:hypothetical protein
MKHHSRTSQLINISCILSVVLGLAFSFIDLATTTPLVFSKNIVRQLTIVFRLLSVYNITVARPISSFPASKYETRSTHK